MDIKKLSPVFIILLFTLLLGVYSAEAIPASVKAKSEYLLGAYLATDQPDLAFAAIESFFEVTPESMSGSDQYSEMVEQYSIIEESVQKLRAVENKKKIAQELLEKKEKIGQKIKYCRAICEADSSLQYHQRRNICLAEAKQKNKSAGRATSEEFELQTDDELAKPCIESAGDVYGTEITFCWNSCEKEKFRQKMLYGVHSENPITIILGESEILGFTNVYRNYAVVILSVNPDSPAKIAGLAARDSIVAVDGNPIESEMYINDIRDKVINGEIESAVLDIRRNGQTIEYLLIK